MENMKLNHLFANKNIIFNSAIAFEFSCSEVVFILTNILIYFNT